MLRFERLGCLIEFSLVSSADQVLPTSYAISHRVVMDKTPQAFDGTFALTQS